MSIGYIWRGSFIVLMYTGGMAETFTVTLPAPTLEELRRGWGREVDGAFATWMKMSMSLLEKEKDNYVEKWARKDLLKCLRWRTSQGRLFQ